MLFEHYTVIDQFEVEIMADPYTYLMNMATVSATQEILKPQTNNYDNKLCLRLYSSDKTKGKFVAEKSGLNQWNAGGRLRKPNEMYIPYPAEDRRLSKDFFPPRDTPFTVLMPDASSIVAKVCQADGKAIMSNPNEALGEWLLRKVFELPKGTVVTYEMLERFGIDSVIFTKLQDGKYKINFGEIGTYEDYTESLETKNT